MSTQPTDALELLREIYADLVQGAIPNADDPWWQKASATLAGTPSPVGAEPMALLVRKNSWRDGQWEAAPRATHGQAPAGAAHEKVDPWGHAIAQEERACRAEDALIDLVNQIRKTSPVDDHGHLLTMNMAYIKSVQLLDSAASTPTAQAANSVPAVSDLPPLPAPDLRDVGTKPQEIKEFLKGYATEYARTTIAARAPADSVLEDAALWHWLAEYLVGTRTDLDDEIVASETVNDLRKLVEAAIKQGEKK